ncbi:ABC transporter substrate-binding protein [Cereibacter changlensis JA139]|uniref:ABC transporter substrate-binding protein n=3 Tax=Cereibacter changlensis TaxID=402884 RepID=A0A2T4JPZ7_9RHOB|nr:ABC transporter substrate-binding protein [Cereibacter changlensis JA139]
MLAVAMASPARAETLLTAHPAATALARTLTAGTGVEVTAVAPEGLPASRLPSYLGGRGREMLERAAGTADAVLTLRSLWPADPLYPAARRANIRIVELDAAMPLDRRLPGIALLDPDPADLALYAMLGLEPMPPAGEETAPWLSPTRLGEMGEIAAADLERLSPGDAPAIRANLARLKQDLRQVKTRADLALADLANPEVVSFSPQFGYLLADLGLELRATVIAAPREWTPERAGLMAQWMQDEGIMTALATRELPELLMQALDAGGRSVVILDSLPGDDLAADIAGNIARLAQ